MFSRSLVRPLLALFALSFAVVPLAQAQLPEIVINEIFYDPPNNNKSEFVELHNPTAADIDISGWKFTDGIDFTFPSGTTIAAGGYTTVCMDVAAFNTQFGFTPLGPFSGKLSGDGEEVVLSDALGNKIDSVDYQATFPWPISPTSSGASMELINPSLDNNLGGSWRGNSAVGSLPELTYIAASDASWHYRKGLDEASSPTDLWRYTGFSEDSTWATTQFPIGYGTVDGLALNTVLSDMRYNYTSVFARHEFTVAAGEVTNNLTLKYTCDDGLVVWINGVEVARRNMNSSVAYNATSNTYGSEGVWYTVNITNASNYLVEGTNTIAVMGFNASIGGSSDFGFDAQLLRPASSTVLQPTPNAQNTVFASNAPPQLRQVDHTPKQPLSTEPTVITVKATDPDGVSAVRCLYQIVAPGSFIPSRFPRTVSQVMANPEGERPINTAFEDTANWSTLVMHDDGTGGDALAGDGIFSVTIPAQAHRTLVRYRIEADDSLAATVRVPYPDDDSLNFAYFVYNGVPDYTASTRSVAPEGAGKVWPKEMLTTLPVYHWIIRNQDMMTLQAYNSSEQFTNNGSDTELAARRAEEWEGAFVYDGVVYDHVTTRLRGGNSRYGDFDGRFPRGKRHYKFKFHQGHYFQARDQYGKKYPVKWKRLALNRMFGTKGGNSWGMPEEVSARMWRTFGVNAQFTHWIHFRVIDNAAEAPSQYGGDFWGISQAVEEYDGSYLDARKLPKGNLYKMSDFIWDAERQRRYQSSDMVSDGSEFNTIRDYLHGGQTATWLNEHVNYDTWYRYSAVLEGIRHYDMFPYTSDIRHALKNLAWYFEPSGTDPTRGLCNFLPYDWDASFGPNFNNGWDHANNALYGYDMSTGYGSSYINKPEMKLEHRNVLREFRDLIWQTDQLNALMDDRAGFINEFTKSDMDRWSNAPTSEGTANDDSLAFKLNNMKAFCFTGWTDPFHSYGDWRYSPPVSSGGRAAYLDTLSNNGDSGYLPNTPTITYTGDANHPLNGLSFSSSNFSDPQGAGTFAAMQWRIGEIEDPTAPAWNEADPFIMEYDLIWASGTLTAFTSSMTIPTGALKPGHTYRARVRMQDDTNRWSHWSAPYQFTTTAPDELADLQNNLMITEVMYNPSGPLPASGDLQDLEYIELQNISTTLTLDLTNVRFTKGVDFDFASSPITSLAPGQYVLIVKNIAAFEALYGSSLPVAGEWDPANNLSNGGERIKLSYGDGVAIHDFTYDDATPWPTEPDGNGSSMSLVDPTTAPDHALPESWTATAPTPGTGPDPFGEWLAAQGQTNPTAEALPGMTWLMMYAIGGDLVANPSSAMPQVSLVEDTDGKHLTLSYRHRLDETQIDYTVETSTELLAWADGTAYTETVGTPSDNGDGTETITVRIPTTIDTDPVRFVRLRVVLSE